MAKFKWSKHRKDKVQLNVLGTDEWVNQFREMQMQGRFESAGLQSSLMRPGAMEDIYDNSYRSRQAFIESRINTTDSREARQEIASLRLNGEPGFIQRDHSLSLEPSHADVHRGRDDSPSDITDALRYLIDGSITGPDSYAESNAANERAARRDYSTRSRRSSYNQSMARGAVLHNYGAAIGTVSAAEESSVRS